MLHAVVRYTSSYELHASQIISFLSSSIVYAFWKLGVFHVTLFLDQYL